MRNEENFGHIVRDKRAISANSSSIKESKKTQKSKIIFLINDKSIISS